MPDIVEIEIRHPGEPQVSLIEVGFRGPPGRDGGEGGKGPDGDPGEKGPDGDKGAVGDQGPRGDRGDKGPTGDAGPVGLPGDKGPQGDKGAAGDPGPEGETGDKGAAGDKGPVGDKGPAGDAGPVPEDYSALRDEVETARGGRANLGLRIRTIADFASPNAGGFIPGRYYDNSFHGTAAQNAPGAAGRVDLAPFYCSQALSVDQIGVAIATGVAGALGRCVVYAAGADGWPAELLFVGAADLDLAASGYRRHDLATPFQFERSRSYWIGFWHSSTASLRGVAVSSSVNLGLMTSASTTYATTLSRFVAYGGALPAAWSFVPADLAANVAPSIRMRAT